MCGDPEALRVAARMGDYSKRQLARVLGWGTTGPDDRRAVILFAFAHGGGVY